MRSNIAVQSPTLPGKAARGFLVLLTLGVVGLLSVLVVSTPLDLHTQALFGGGVFLLSLLLHRNNRRWVTLALMAVSVLVSTRYLYWRLVL